MLQYIVKSVLTIATLAAVILSPTVHAQQTGDPLTVYSGRSKSLVDPIIQQFTRETGIEVEVRYADTSQLTVLLKEEGEQSPADVFWAQDAGALGAMVSQGGLQQLPDDVLGLVGEPYKSPDGLWVATSGRARVLAYSPQRISEDDLPQSIFDLTDSRYQGRVGWAPANASFQAFVTAMRVTHGEEVTRDWLESMKANGARSYPKNTAIIQAIAAGEVDLGLPNHYYLLRFKKSDGEYPVEQTTFATGDIGNLINVAGIGILNTSDQPADAAKFIGFLLSPKAQQYFTSDTFEYPVTDDVIPNTQLIDPAVLNHNAPQVDLDALDDLPGTLDLLREVGLL